MTGKIAAFFKSDKTKDFFMGRKYPLIVSAFVAFAAISGLELYIAILHLAVALVAIFVTSSFKPALITLLTMVMHISVKNAPFYPTYSKYYHGGWQLAVFIALCVTVFCFLVLFIIKNRIYRRVRFGKTPMLASILVFSAALLLNGIGSGKWETGDLIFGFANAVVYSFVFIFLYYSLGDESSDELTSYFSYLSTLISFIIISELVALFITSDNIFIDGSINKVGVALGWGIWNLVGTSLSVLIPIIFYGVHNNKHPWYYFISATLTFVFSVLTMSRNALLFSAIAYGACVIISCFKGKYKKAFRIITAVGIFAIALLVIVFFGKIRDILADYFERGFSDNGRFALWGAAIDNFLGAPVFGGGFYGFNVDDSMLYGFGPLAKQAHNTILQLLSATGIVGFLSYIYYRYESIKPLFRRPSMKKTLLAMSIAVFLFSSLLDNFVFNIYPTFHYTVSLVLLHKDHAEKQGIAD